MAPVYDLAHSKYAPTAIAGCFAAALVVLAVMVASTSAGIGGQLRPAATPAESRTVVDGPAAAGGAELFRVLEGPVPFGVIFRGPAQEAAAGPSAPANDPSTPAAPPAAPPGAPSTPVDQPVTQITNTADETVDDAEGVIDDLAEIIDSLLNGTTTGGLVP